MADVLASGFVAAEYRDAARAEIAAQLSTEGVLYDTSGFFVAELSESGDAPATHYISSGYWHPGELEALVNGVTPRVVKFGDVQAAMVSLGLRPVVPVEPMAGNANASLAAAFYQAFNAQMVGRTNAEASADINRNSAGTNPNVRAARG